MRLTAPVKAPLLNLVDIYDQRVTIGGPGRRTLLCFFRDAACPFCNFRIYELTRHHASLAALGLDVIAVFASTPEEVRRFVARKPRPFVVVADPTSSAHEAYGIERSFWRKWKGVVSRIPTLLEGLRIVEAYYGSDAGDRIPFERIELFLARSLLKRVAIAA